MAPKLIKAVVLVGISLGYEDKVTNTVKKLDGVKDAFQVYGEHDLVIMIETDSIEKMNAIVQKTRKLEGVTRTVTLVAM